MNRQEMIKTLVLSALTGKPDASKEEVAEYVKYLNTKSDLELQNMVMINCF